MYESGTGQDIGYVMEISQKSKYKYLRMRVLL